QEPQSHDVVQEPVAPVHPAFVGEVRFPGGVGGDRGGGFHSYQAPGAAGDVGGRVGVHRYGGDGGGGVVGADGEDGQSCRGGEFGVVDGADHFAGVDEFGEQVGGDRQVFHEVDVPLPAGSQQPGGGGVGAFGAHCPGEQVGNEVGDEQQVLGLGQVGFDGELVHGVEGEELQPVAAVELLEGHNLVGVLHSRLGALIAVVEGE